MVKLDQVFEQREEKRNQKLQFIVRDLAMKENKVEQLVRAKTIVTQTHYSINETAQRLKDEIGICSIDDRASK